MLAFLRCAGWARKASEIYLRASEKTVGESLPGLLVAEVTNRYKPASWTKSIKGVQRPECRRRTLNRKEQLWHRAVSLRQHGFLIENVSLHRCERLRCVFAFINRFSRWIRSSDICDFFTIWQVIFQKFLEPRTPAPAVGDKNPSDIPKSGLLRLYKPGPLCGPSPPLVDDNPQLPL